jgi:hypothetical protein
MFRGSDFDRQAQQRVFAGRDWIDAQPGLVAQGRAVCLFNAETRSPEFLEELIERFYRAYVFIDTTKRADWMSRIGAAGHHAYPYTVFVARRQLEHCKSLIEQEPPLRGASVMHLPDHGEPHVLEQVQQFYQRANQLPQQPDYFVGGNNGTVITSVLLDGEGLAIGATMFHHLVKAGPEYAEAGLALSSVIAPSRSPGVSRNPADGRRSSLAAWLNAHAVVRSRELFGTREIWSHPSPTNRRSIAFHRELGSVQHEDLSCFCAEHRTAPLDRRHLIGTPPVAAADGEAV